MGTKHLLQPAGLRFREITAALRAMVTFAITDSMALWFTFFLFFFLFSSSYSFPSF